MKFLQFFCLLLAHVCLFSSGVLFAEDLIHIVGRGDTIFSLARFYQVTADDLMRVNGITDPSRLSVGRRLVIPVSADTVHPASAHPAVVPPAVNVALVNYRAVRGDTLFSIARTHGITLQRLLEINGFSSNHTLRAGDVIRVPGRANPPAASSNTEPARAPSGLYALRWPVTPKDITYMTGQMGVVVEGERNEAVLSLTQGHVVSAGPWRKFGRVVIVETAGGYYYMYGGCETISVNVGDRISPGMELGRLGVNSVSEKPQLFFMVFRNDLPIDPATVLRTGTATSGNNTRS